jgi:hypothetical protein
VDETGVPCASLCLLIHGGDGQEARHLKIAGHYTENYQLKALVGKKLWDEILGPV